MGKPKGRCKFNPNWKNSENFPQFSEWVERCNNNNFRACCKLCSSDFDIGNMGVSALSSHAKSQTHRSAKKVKKSYNIMSSFKTTANLSSPNILTITNNNNLKQIPENSMPENCSGVSSDKINQSNSNAVDQLINRKSISTPTKATNLDKYVTTADVARAEIYYCFCQVKKQASSRCFSELSDCFPLMFHDSEIAKKMRIHKDKLSYSITYGLGPYCQEELSNSVRKCNYFSISFDESLNKIAQKEQMDLIVRFWQDNSNTIETRYLSSCFLTAATAEDFLEAFKSEILKLGLKLEKIIQFSLDGPNVNLKFLRIAQDYLTDTNDGPKILNTGTCSLHIVNGAYKSGHQKTGWEINKFLRSLYFLFKDYPVRRGTYVRITGSNVFPLKFCSIRWTENSNVMDRARQMIPFLTNYVRSVLKKPPSTKNFEIVKHFLTDKLLDAKLGFLISISLDLEKFLCTYQDSKPLLPFLFNDLYTLHTSLIARILKKDIFKNIRNVADLFAIDLDKKDNLCLPSKTDVGFIAKSVLKHLKDIKETETIKFQMDCQKFIIEICKKLKDKSPLQYDIVKGASCLSPFVMQIPDTAKIRAEIALQVLEEKNHINAIEGEYLLKEYTSIIENERIKKELLKFDKKKDRLDSFLLELCKEAECSEKFINFIKKILILFHGNSDVERSFSFNKEFLVENLQEDSLKAQRSVHDFIMSVGKVIDIQITKNMIIAFQNSSKHRVEALKKKRESEDSAKKRKRELCEEISIMKMRKKEAVEILGEKKVEISTYDKELKKLEGKLRNN